MSSETLEVGRPSDSAAGASGPGSAAGASGRLVGVDLARGLAVLGMMAAHVFGDFEGNGSTPTLVYRFSSGRSTATFALVAGISLTFIAGRRPPRWGSRARAGISAGLVVRALLIGLLGLALNIFAPQEAILPAYAVLFLLTIPLLGLSRRALVIVVAGLVVVAPLLVVGSYATDLPALEFPDLTDLLHPFALLVTLFITGFYPVVEYLAFLCAGLVIGKSDLSSPRVATWLLGGGAALSLGAWLTSGLLLFHFGGVQHLLDAGAAPDGLSPRAARDYVVWQPDNVATWWYFTGRAPYSVAPLFILHALGTAVAVVGASLLLVRLRVVARLFTPVAAVGSITLTIYSAHLVVLATPLLENDPLALYLTLVAASMVFAVTWRRYRGQGPLETIVTRASKAARRAVTQHGVQLGQKQGLVRGMMLGRLAQSRASDNRRAT